MSFNTNSRTSGHSRTEDDLEYHINFPSPEQISASSSVGNFVADDDKPRKSDEYENFLPLNEDGLTVRNKAEPVVFLLGWLGAQDRHLAKYSSLYNKLGCITVRYTAPSKNLFFAPDTRLKLIAKKLLTLMEETYLSHHPVIFHNFSNHGSALYSYISDLLDKAPKSPLEVKGCIFDSAPAPRRLTTGVRAVYRSVQGPLWFRLLTSSAISIYLFCWGALSVFLTLVTGHLPNSPPWSLMNEPFRWPQLFLYSKCDDLIPSEDVELFASERKSLGVNVTMHEFINSPHVLHYRVHPEEYSIAVRNFMNLCLQGQNYVNARSKEEN